MRAVIARVASASVETGGRTAGTIGAGLLVLLGVGHDDAPAGAGAFARKIVELRVFPDAAGAMNRSLVDAGGDLLVVSQFTLFGDARHGRRPSFTAAAAPVLARPVYEAFVAAARGLVARVETGVFGADMAVRSVNDGPVTILLDSSKTF